MDAIMWQPKNAETSNMWHFMQFVSTKQQKLTDYQQLHQWSLQHPAAFWQAICDFFQVQFDTPAKQVLNDYAHMLDARWFTGARFNFAEKLLSRRDSHPAFIAVNETGERTVFTYQQLYQAVAGCAAGLRKAGVGRGDRVAAIMPNVPQTIIAMLATASIGAIWSSCSPDFGSQAALDRLGQINPKVLFIYDGHQYMGKQHEASTKLKSLSQAIKSLQQIIICPIIHCQLADQIPVKLLTWDEFIEPAEECFFEQLPFAHPLYILFSSGTTGKPKCIVHGSGGTLLQHLKELGLHTDLRADDNLCFYTTCGWMMWNWMVSALALGCTLTLYEGAPTYPDANHLFHLIDKEQITVFGTSAKFISTVEKMGVCPSQQNSLKSLRTILSTGSPLLPKNYDFVYQAIKSDVQLSSISGGTDIISCFALGNPLLPVYRGELQCLGLGMAVAVVDEHGQAIEQARGELVCTQAFPAMPVGFWQDPGNEAYKKAYFKRFPGIWAHGDYAEITQHHGLIIYGRSDAVLNPGGVRIGTAEIYRQVEKIPDILDSVVIDQVWQDDVRIVLFVKLKAGVQLDEALLEKIRQAIRHDASPRHVPAKILDVADIPHTLSGKTVEIAVRQVVHGEPINNLDSLANPEALEYFKNRAELST